MGDAQAPQRIGDYEILGVLGAGGMGKVYKVRNAITDRVEAMKILLPDLTGQKELAERFQREIKVLASLNHPNIAQLRTALSVENQLLMIMEFVEGTSLAARVEQGAIPPAEAVNYIDQVLSALSYAHQRHIVHRDIKPANMMLTPEGLVKLMDFGIARASDDRGLTITGTSLGSLPYMSPEQIMGSKVDARADLYSTGVSLYEMVAGRRPFQANSDYAMMAAHMQDAPTPLIEVQPGLPDALNQAILIALAKKPEERFQSADAFRNALKAVSEGLQGQAAPAVAPVVRQDAPTISMVGTPATPPVQPMVPPASQPSISPASGPAPGVPSRTGVSTVAPSAASVQMPAQPPPSTARQGSYRGLYMTLGALIVVAVLVVAGIYGPRWAKTRAAANAPSNSLQTSQPVPNGTPSPSGTPTTNPANNAAQTSQSPTATTSTFPLAAPASAAKSAKAGSYSSASQQPSPNPASASQSIANPQASEPSPSRARARPMQAAGAPQGPGSSNAASASGLANQQSAQSASQQPAGIAAPQATAPSAAELDEAQHQMDQISARASTARDSVETLRRQENAQGLNLRGDISAAENRMAADLDSAQAALQKQNIKDAEKYMARAENELETLEKFLGLR